METSIAILLVLAFVAANLPFLTKRVAGVWSVTSKHFGWHLLELVVLYLLLGVLAYALESRHTSVHDQKWQFYVTTIALFLVFAFPGFVGRYFWKKRSV